MRNGNFHRGLGKSRRKKTKLRDNIKGISKPTIRKLARRAGVDMISAGVYDVARVELKEFLVSVVSDAIIYTEYAHRKTVTVQDVLYALKNRGRTYLYGFGG